MRDISAIRGARAGARYASPRAAQRARRAARAHADEQYSGDAREAGAMPRLERVSLRYDVCSRQIIDDFRRRYA